MQQAYEANKRLAAIIGLDVDHMGPDELAKMDRAALEQQAREIALKARDDELKRRTEQAKRVDYLVRALRETERPKAEAASRQLYEQITSVATVYNENTLAEALEKRATAAALKSSLSKMVPHVDSWEDRVLEARRAVYDAEKVSHGGNGAIWQPRSSRYMWIGYAIEAPAERRGTLAYHSSDAVG
jgi:hypothetical protein